MFVSWCRELYRVANNSYLRWRGGSAVTCTRIALGEEQDAFPSSHETKLVRTYNSNLGIPTLSGLKDYVHSHAFIYHHVFIYTCMHIIINKYI